MPDQEVKIGQRLAAREFLHVIDDEGDRLIEPFGRVGEPQPEGPIEPSSVSASATSAGITSVLASAAPTWAQSRPG